MVKAYLWTRGNFQRLSFVQAQPCPAPGRSQPDHWKSQNRQIISSGFHCLLSLWLTPSGTSLKPEFFQGLPLCWKKKGLYCCAEVADAKSGLQQEQGVEGSCWIIWLCNLFRWCIQVTASYSHLEISLSRCSSLNPTITYFYSLLLSSPSSHCSTCMNYWKILPLSSNHVCASCPNPDHIRDPHF